MADRVPDDRLTQVVSTLREWHGAATYGSQEALNSHLRSEAGPHAPNTDEMLALAEEVAERRHASFRIASEPHGTTIDGLIAQARERLAASIAAGQSERAESWGRLLVTLLRCDDKPTRTAEPPRVSGPELKQEMLSGGREREEGVIIPLRVIQSVLPYLRALGWDGQTPYPVTTEDVRRLVYAMHGEPVPFGGDAPPQPPAVCAYPGCTTPRGRAARHNPDWKCLRHREKTAPSGQETLSDEHPTRFQAEGPIDKGAPVASVGQGRVKQAGPTTQPPGATNTPCAWCGLRAGTLAVPLADGGTAHACSDCKPFADIGERPEAPTRPPLTTVEATMKEARGLLYGVSIHSSVGETFKSWARRLVEAIDRLVGDTPHATSTPRVKEGVLGPIAPPRLGILVPPDVIRPVLPWLEAWVAGWAPSAAPSDDEKAAFLRALKAQPVPVTSVGAAHAAAPEAAPVAPIGHEMLANATRDRISALLKSIGKGGTTLERDKAEVMRRADDLHAMALGRTPAERERKLEDVANTARDMQQGAAGAQMRLEEALRALDGVTP